MQIYGQGSEGHILNGVLVNAGAPTAGPANVFLIEVNVVSLQLITSAFTGAFTGNWKVEASNNFAPDPSYMGQPKNAGDWTDVTAFAIWDPAITAAITANGTQMVTTKYLFGWRAIRVSVTRTGGTSVVVDCWVQGKGA
jgi:hypothetical protein